LGTVPRWIVSTTGVSNVTAVGRRPMHRSAASIVVSVLSENANANAAETAMETESGTGSTESASGILNGIETDVSATASVTGNESGTVTVNEVTGTDGTKRIAIERAGRTAMSAVGLCSLRRTAANLRGRDIVLLRQPRTHSGSEEDPPTMMYVTPLSMRLVACIYHVLSWFDSQNVSPSAALARRAAKIAAGGRPTRRKTTNVFGSQIGVVEIGRKTPAMDARHRHHQTRCENPSSFVSLLCCYPNFPAPLYGEGGGNFFF